MARRRLGFAVLPIAGEQFVGDAAQHVGDPSLRIDTVALAGQLTCINDIERVCGIVQAVPKHREVPPT